MAFANVKVFLFVSLHFVIAYAAYTQENIKTLASACNANDADLEVALKYEVPDTDTGKCLMMCMLKALKTISPEGFYDLSGTYESFKTYWGEFSDDKLKKIADDCNTEMSAFKEQANTCEYGYKAIKCINTKFKELNLLKQYSS